MSQSILRAAVLAPALFAVFVAPPAVASDLLLGGAEVPLAVAHLALLAPPLAEAEGLAAEAQQEIPEQEPEPRPQPFPAPPEQPPAERIPEEPEELPADQPPAEDPDIEIEVPEVETELPEVEVDDELEVEAETDTVWYADPFWILVALVFVVVILILIFAGRRRG